METHLEQIKAELKQANVMLEQVRVFNATSSFDKFWNIKKYYQNEPKFNGVYSWNTLTKMKDRVYKIHLHEFKLVRTYWIAFKVNVEKVTYFDSFEFGHVPKEILKIIGKTNMIKNI